MKKLVFAFLCMMFSAITYGQYSGGKGDGYAMAQNAVVTHVSKERIAEWIPGNIVRKGESLTLGKEFNEPTRITLVNQVGQTVYSETRQQEGDIPTQAHWSTGVYVLVLENKRISISYQIIIRD